MEENIKEKFRVQRVERKRILPVDLRIETGLLGVTTWPSPIIDMRGLKNLEEWLLASSEGHLGFNNRVFEVYMNERNLMETFKFLFQNEKTGWMWVGNKNSFFAPNGTSVFFRAINFKE
jgi:hypothetical protein